MKKIILFLFAGLLASCAQLHHVQVGEIASHPKFKAERFDLKISETGINIDEAAQIGKAFMQKSSQREATDRIAGIIGLFQMGPRTGNPVYTKSYADNLILAIYDKCPSGNITGLLSVRETRKYPVVSGEIVKVTGYCLVPKGG